MFFFLQSNYLNFGVQLFIFSYESVLCVSCHSETDDSSSIPVAERTEVSPSARKPSLHLTLPDFQDASTGLRSSLTHFYSLSFGVRDYYYNRGA